jgi:hypothetical protein
MKHEFLITVASAMVVLSLTFLFLSGPGLESASRLTGLATEDITIENETLDSNSDSNTGTTREEALEAIKESERIISEMISNGFTVGFANDTLVEANRVFEQAEFASILRGEAESTESNRREARRALQLVNWKDITYENVLIQTDAIETRKNQAFIILDSINAVKKNLEESETNNDDISKSLAVLAQAEDAFKGDRFDEAQELLEEFSATLELERSEATRLGTIRKNAGTFIQRNWYFVALAIILIVFAVRHGHEKISRKLLKKKIEKMEVEAKVLKELMRTAQIERFRKNTISDLVYNIRMDKYKKRLQKIRQELPVMEGRLNKEITNKRLKKRAKQLARKNLKKAQK